MRKIEPIINPVKRLKTNPVALEEGKIKLVSKIRNIIRPTNAPDPIQSKVKKLFK